MGEIPPYAISYAAAKAGKANSELDEWNEPSKYDIINRMKEWMLGYLKEYGFWAILAFASWPNMAFDLCGLACGHFMLPFWTFFGATLIGKALIKVNLQACFFIVIFTDEYLKAFVGFVTSISSAAGGTLNEFLEKQKLKFHGGNTQHEEEPPAFLKQVWGFVMMLFIGWFLSSMITSLAQQHAAELDGKKNAHLKKNP